MNLVTQNLKKRERERRIEALVQFQKRALDKFLTSNKKNKNEEVNNEVDDTHWNQIVENYDDYALKNIYDPSQWTNIDTNLRDLLIEKGPIKITDIEFPKDKNSRHFSIAYYIKKMPNGEKYERRWLVYSKDLDKVFCFCCKLFDSTSNTNKLANEGTNDWKNLGNKIKEHEISNEHVVNMSSWTDLEARLLKNKTIDKHAQEQIDRDKEHWGKYIIKNYYCALIEMIAEFDPIMQEHIRLIKHNEIHNHYLGHNIQNKLINLLGSEVKSKIIDKIIEAKYFSIILDCTPDLSHQEQMSFVLRNVNISSDPIKVIEYFLKFLKVDDTSGKSLFEVIVDEIKDIGLDIDNLRG
ncbi:hypothetical protein CDL12_00667 [Handroanthus impetiginosus]|uniref:TTF-type domain-containing protein n=1 Tax=Handroanthus impetiginosus TaxID=429701 RepID=A0A2G9I9Z6_9LAMI|nr:hypothetical protein CDL12_00667 [Handroanthus impetiginosus]